MWQYWNVILLEYSILTYNTINHFETSLPHLAFFWNQSQNFFFLEKNSTDTDRCVFIQYSFLKTLKKSFSIIFF